MTDTASNRTATVPYRVRFDECAADGLARTSALLRYAQDVAWIHSERLGFDRDWYAARGLTWLVRAARVVVLRAVPLGTTLDVSTTVDGFRKVWARRRTDGRLADGTLAFWAHTDWVIIDARGLPTRVPAEFPAVYGELPGPFEPGRVALPPTPAGAAVHRGPRPSAGRRPAGPRQQRRLPRLPRGGVARRRAGRGRRGRAPSPGPCASSTCSRRCPATVVTGSTWRDEPATGDGARWAWRLTDDDGADLARGTLDGRGGTPDTPDTDQAADRSAP